MLARMIEAGFVLPADAGPARNSKVRLLRIAGIRRELPYFRVGLSSGATARERDVFVVAVDRPPLGEDAIASIAAVLVPELPPRSLVFLREDRTGFARATCTRMVLPELAAAAVATLKTVAGDDESPRIAVEVDGEEFAIAMVKSDDHWYARVRLATLT